MNKVYAGIGSREVPDDVIEKIFLVAITLANKGFVLRSGGADGCDSAFEVGCDSVSGKKEIFLPWEGFNTREGINSETLPTYDQAQRIAANFHPSWGYLDKHSRKLHTRNVYQVLGQDLNSSADFVICYTSDGKATGGTGQAVRIAKAKNIRIYNLYFPETFDTIQSL